MATTLQAIRGMNDVLPDEAHGWLAFEEIVRGAMFRHGYRNIRTPLLEPTSLFRRPIGAATHLTQKELTPFPTHTHRAQPTLPPQPTPAIARTTGARPPPSRTPSLPRCAARSVLAARAMSELFVPTTIM